VRSSRAIVLLVALAVVGLPTTASAHGLTARPDLPVPAWLFAWAAAIVLVVSFVGLAALWRTPRLQGAPADGPATRASAPSRVLEALAGALGVSVLTLVVVAGLFGTEIAVRNIAPQIVFLQFWVWLVPVSVLLGDVFRLINPWRAIGRLVIRTAPRPYPARLGRWPAVGVLLAFAVLELVLHRYATPRGLAIAALLYTALTLAGMARYGVETWCERGEGFAVYFNLFGRMSPLAVRGGRLRLRPVLGGLPQLAELPGTAAVIVVMIGSITWDGLAENPWWLKVGAHLRDAFGSLGAGDVVQGELTALIGLTLSLATIGALLLLGSLGARGGTAGDTAGVVAQRFAHTLVPIAFAYVGAHYLTFALFTGQQIWPLLSDPLGTGANYFGTTGYVIDFTWLGARTVWYLQVGIVVVGHVAALALAHDRALVLYRNAQKAVRSQFAMLAVMVAFTSLALWLLSEANA
jgi:hypothetical protein